MGFVEKTSKEHFWELVFRAGLYGSYCCLKYKIKLDSLDEIIPNNYFSCTLTGRIYLVVENGWYTVLAEIVLKLV